MRRLGTYNGFAPEQRLRALAWLKRQYRAGRRTPPTRCEVCGQDRGLVTAHSEDYSGPPFGANIGRFGLCYRCHQLIHARFRAPAAFEHYAEMVEQGWVYPPVKTWDYTVIRLQHLRAPDAPPPEGSVPHDPPLGDPDLLRRIAAGEFAPARAEAPGEIPPPARRSTARRPEPESEPQPDPGWAAAAEALGLTERT